MEKMRVKAGEIQVGDMLYPYLDHPVERVNIAKRVALRTRGRRGSITYRPDVYVTIVRPAAA